MTKQRRFIWKIQFLVISTSVKIYSLKIWIFIKGASAKKAMSEVRGISGNFRSMESSITHAPVGSVVAVEEERCQSQLRPVIYICCSPSRMRRKDEPIKISQQSDVSRRRNQFSCHARESSNNWAHFVAVVVAAAAAANEPDESRRVSEWRWSRDYFINSDQTSICCCLLLLLCTLCVCAFSAGSIRMNANNFLIVVTTLESLSRWSGDKSTENRDKPANFCTQPTIIIISNWLKSLWHDDDDDDDWQRESEAKVHVTTCAITHTIHCHSKRYHSLYQSA
jgi:hypothetical protein